VALAALRLEGAGFRYPRAAEVALGPVDLAVAAGEAVGLFGANGAGKSTLARLAMALLHPTEGRVVTVGDDTRGRGPEDFADRVGFLFQHPEAQLFATTVEAELAFGPRQLGWDAARTRERAGAVLEALALAPHAGTHPYDLPAPMRRLVALGTALMAEPALLILDEPTAGLDRASRRLVERVVRDVVARGAAVLAITHDGDFAVEALGRGVVLAEGRVADDGPVDAVLRRHAGGDLPAAPHAGLVARLGLRPASLRLADVAAAVRTRRDGARAVSAG